MNIVVQVNSRTPGARLSKRTARAYTANADTAPRFWMIGVLWRMLATGIQTGNSMCLLDQTCSVGSGPARHAHPQEEGLYVLKGKVSFQAGGTSFAAGAGSLVTIPRHTEHSFVVEEEAILINFYFPAGFDLWLMGSAVPAKDNKLPPKDLAPPVLEVSKRLSDDYGGLPLTKERSTSANPDAPALPSVNSMKTAESFWFRGDRWSILAEGSSTGGSYSSFEVQLRKGTAYKPFLHDLTDIAYYVFEGDLTFSIDSETIKAGKGCFVFVPRGSLQDFEVISKTARFLCIHTEPGFERVVRTLGIPASESSLPPNSSERQASASRDFQTLFSDLGLREVEARKR